MYFGLLQRGILRTYILMYVYGAKIQYLA